MGSLDSLVHTALYAHCQDTVDEACHSLRKSVSSRQASVEEVIRLALRSIERHDPLARLRGFQVVYADVMDAKLPLSILRPVLSSLIEKPIDQTTEPGPPSTERRLLYFIRRSFEGLAWQEKEDLEGFRFFDEECLESADRLPAAMVVALVVSGFPPTMMERAGAVLKSMANSPPDWRGQVTLFPMAAAGQALGPEAVQLAKRALGPLSEEKIARGLLAACEALRDVKQFRTAESKMAFRYLAAIGWSAAQALEGRKLQDEAAEVLKESLLLWHEINLNIIHRSGLVGFYGKWWPLSCIYTDVFCLLKRPLEGFPEASKLEDLADHALNALIERAFQASDVWPDTFGVNMQPCIELGERISGDPDYTIRRVYEGLWGVGRMFAPSIGIGSRRRERFIRFLIELSKTRPELIERHAAELVQMEGPVAEGAYAFLEKALQVV